ncbi:ShlB/FhaC/HecB family hemolysin secretion/activation protein [Hydrogenovibrio kuenenii]|uniref:ShlB/FhaC/HecB family hemolysin secretion/activation protein n=1 Tax=Hydrogenovibrio kuenenii TaxID=63658 RepID=UPI000467D52A|nr:ShlB/FhaC/HecB family hemolysin secretion/activation protein [Hydrogenovibrio kuenenii]
MPFFKERDPIRNIGLLAGFFSCTSAIAAQPTVPDAGSLLRDLEKNTPQQAPATDHKSQLPAPMKDTGIKIKLQSVEFKGFESLATNKELQSLVKPAIGQKLGFNGLQHLADLVTEYLVNKGFFLAFAYLPEQDVSNGHLIITAQLGQIESNGKWYRKDKGKGINLSSEQISGTLNYNLKPETPRAIRVGLMERGLLIFNDLSGVKATSTLARGSEPGTTRMNVLLKATPRYTGNAWLDNYGNRYTGSARVNALGKINNVSGIGDQLNATASVTQNLKYARLGYQAPVGYSGLTANANLSFMNYTLGEDLSNLGYSGSAATLSGGLRYPITRSRQKNLYASATLDYQSLEDKQNAATIRDRKYTNLTLELNGDNWDRWRAGGLNNYGISLTLGDLDRKGNQTDYNYDQSTAKTQGFFTKLNLNASRLQKLTHRSSLLMKANLQPYASGNLDSSEKFSLGGPNGLRAYPVGEGTGDLGWLLSLEGRYDLPKSFIPNSKLQLQTFIDTGHVTLQANPWAGYVPANTNKTNDYQMSDFGIGATLSQAGRYSLQASYAWKLNDQVNDRTTTGKDTENQANSGRFWLQAIAWF